MSSWIQVFHAQENEQWACAQTDQSTRTPYRPASPAYRPPVFSDVDRMKSAFLLVAVIPLVLAAPALNVACAAAAVEPPPSATDVYTRAIVRSISEEDGKRLYIRLKLIPRSKIPFSTVTYRVFDPRLMAGLREGQSVAFRAERLDGENVLTAIRIETPCQRFKECK